MLFSSGRKPLGAWLGGLAMLVLIAPTLTSPRDTRAEQEEPGPPQRSPDGGEAAAPVEDEEQALGAFLEAYRLAPGQNIKRVPPPRPEGIRAWAIRHSPRTAGQLKDIRALVFGWRDPDQLQVWARMFGGTEGWSIHDLPRWMKMDIYPFEIEGEAELLNTEISGDWIVRESVPAEQLIRPLEAILQRVLRRRITLALRRVERDVVVARGRYHSSPLPGHGEDHVEIYGRKLSPNGGGGSGGFAQFLKWVGDWIGRPIVNEVESPPTGIIGWHYNQSQPFAERTQLEDRDETLVLKHIQEQTGLTFGREKRPVRILFVEQPRSPR
jgi:Protein of unknown function (DUF3738)